MNKRLPQEIIQTPVAGMQKITARFRVTTPMFMGGADNKTTAELRAPSLKSVLRFWWRALAWSRCDENLERIRKEEAALFGSDETGQGKFLMRLLLPAEPKVVQVKERPFGLANLDGAKYLGYGCIEAFGSAKKGTQAGELVRPCLEHPFGFSLDIASRRAVGQDLIDALKLFGLLGGAGSKSRKGYGSLTLCEIAVDGQKAWAAPASSADFIREVSALLGPAMACRGLPAYSAFSSLSRVDILGEGNDPLRLLDTVGRKMQQYRCWGHNGMVNRQPSERNFREDHDWCYRPSPSAHPRRVVFGLPHNYARQGVNCDPGGSAGGRRASPLHLHIHEYRPGSYAAIATVLASALLPSGCGIKVHGKGVSRPFEVPLKADYSVIDGFLDGYEGPSDRKTKNKYFPNARKVFPS